MDIQLRRRHTYIWVFLAVLLPSLVIGAYFSIPEKAVDIFSRADETAYSSIVLSQQTADLKINIRKGTVGKYQVEVIVLKPLIGADNQLFLSTAADNSKRVLLGSLASRGVYYFPLPDSLDKTSTLFFTVFDAIKKREVERFSIRTKF